MVPDESPAPDSPETPMVALMRFLNPPAVMTVLGLLRSAGIEAESTVANDNPFDKATDQGSVHTVAVAREQLDDAKAVLSAAGWKV